MVSRSKLIGPKPIKQYVTALKDKNVPKHLAQVLLNWRKLATSLDYNGPVAWSVKAGFTVEAYAPKAVSYFDRFSYLQEFSFMNEEPTPDAIVFWVPRLLANSTSKTVGGQLRLMTDVRVRYELPVHHLTSFGSAALLLALILAHYKLTGENVPLDDLWARSDNFYRGGYCLPLGTYCGVDLFCVSWCYNEESYEYLGAFPLGVEVKK